MLSAQRISEMCCFDGGDMLNIDWPEDSVEKAKIIRTKAQSMTGYVEAVSNSFITG